jgi:hypothetical protein
MISPTPPIPLGIQLMALLSAQCHWRYCGVGGIGGIEKRPIKIRQYYKWRKSKPKKYSPKTAKTANSASDPPQL